MNTFSDLTKRLLETYISKDPEEPRCYIGASSIGHDCDRKIWIQWRGEINPKDFMNEENFGKRCRVFYRGKKEEENIINRLQTAGYLLSDQQKQFLLTTPTTANQGHAVNAFPYFMGLKGHIDGIIVDDKDPEKKKYILEIKTAKQESFKGVQKYFNKNIKNNEQQQINEEINNDLLLKGLEEIYAQYVQQVQIYMYLADVHQALILLINKNNDDIQTIIMKYDQQKIQGIMEKVRRIVSMDSLPLGLKNDNNPPYQCKMCEFKNFCYKEQKEKQ